MKTVAEVSVSNKITIKAKATNKNLCLDVWDTWFLWLYESILLYAGYLISLIWYLFSRAWMHLWKLCWGVVLFLWAQGVCIWGLSCIIVWIRAFTGIIQMYCLNGTSYIRRTSGVLPLRPHRTVVFYLQVVHQIQSFFYNIFNVVFLCKNKLMIHQSIYKLTSYKS